MINIIWLVLLAGGFIVAFFTGQTEQTLRPLLTVQICCGTGPESDEYTAFGWG